MKKAFAVILLLALVLVGCANQNHADLPGTEAFQINPDPTFSTEAIEVAERLDDTEAEDNSLPAETETTTGKEQSTESAETAETPANPSATIPNTTNPKPNEDKPKEDPPKENGTVPTAPAPTEPEATEPETEAIEPPTNSTEPPTEPTGCTHEWKCIHHAEEGHWMAGIMCDCGWTVYGDPSELTSLWNVHSASFPPAESLFDHGGFGSMDEWIMDKPAYDEWVCRHCGETKE